MNSLRIVENKREVEYLLEKGYKYLFTIDGRINSSTAYVFEDIEDPEQDIDRFYFIFEY